VEIITVWKVEVNTPSLRDPIRVLDPGEVASAV
jgi:hypothetical protein